MIGKKGDKKIFWYEVTTSGKRPGINDVVRLAAVVEYNGTMLERKLWHIRPLNECSIDETHLGQNGLSKQQVLSFPDQKAVYREVLRFFKQFISISNPEDVFQPASYNLSKVSHPFLADLIKKNSDGHECFFSRRGIDVKALFKQLDAHGIIDVVDRDYSLGSALKTFGLPGYRPDDMFDRLYKIKAVDDYMRANYLKKS